MTRLEYKKKCNEIGLGWTGLDWTGLFGNRWSRKGGRILPNPITLKKSASKEWERIETRKVSVWVRRVGWRGCIANGTASLRHSPRVNGGEEKWEQESASKGKEMRGEMEV